MTKTFLAEEPPRLALFAGRHLSQDTETKSVKGVRTRASVVLTLSDLYFAF
jgi:hypothetical protein